MTTQSLAPAGPNTLVGLDRHFSEPLREVVVGGCPLGFREVLAVARGDVTVRFTDDSAVLRRIAVCHERMLRDVAGGVPVYGCNTGYGAQSGRAVIPDGSDEKLQAARAISEAIAAIDVSVGPPFGADVVCAGVLLRINMLMSGVSAVRLADLDLLRRLLNDRLTPYVQQYGGIGASGDLAHNARVVSILRQLPGAKVRSPDGVLRDARETLSAAGYEPLRLDPKAGLGLCNGDNFSTGLATLLAADTVRLLLLAVAASALTVEVVRGTDRSFHPLLDMVRPHPGQREAAILFRHLLAGSQLDHPG